MKRILTLLFILISNFTYCQQTTWQSEFLGYPNHLTAICFPSASTGYIFGEEIYYKTTNSGINWNKSDMPFKFIEASFLDNNTGYALAKSSNQGDTTVVLKTTNGGGSWSNYRLRKNNSFKGVKVINTNLAYVFETGNFHRTTNAGLSWVLYGPYSFIDNWDAHDTYLWGVGTSNQTSYTLARISKSTDNGLNWTSFTYGNSDTYYYGKEIFMINNNVGYFSWNTSSFGVANRLSYTNNGGLNWNIISTVGQGTENMYYFNAITGFGFRANTSTSSVIYKTSNSGSNWRNVVVQEYVNDIIFTSELIGFCVANYGVLLKTINGGEPIGIRNISNEIPNNFLLLQNYPNPFNPSTNINFSIPSNTFVTIRVFDISGKDISTLVNENLNAGSYKVDFDGSHYPSGVYYYKIETENFTETKKMILLK